MLLSQQTHKDYPDTLDPLASATRDQLWAWAKQNGIDFDHKTTPAKAMELVLRQKGLTKIPVPVMRLGAPNLPAQFCAPSDSSAHPVNLDDELLAKYQEKPKPAAPEKPAVSAMTIQELRKECRARDIKMDRTDNIAKLREKLGG